MSTLLTIEEQALALPEHARAHLAEQLLRSLPPVLHDEDGGVAEALRRAAEMEADPSIGLSLEELDASLRRRGA